MLFEILEYMRKLFIIGLTIFGGGPVFIPMMELMFVKDLKYFTPQEFDVIVGIVNALPGPVGPKIAGYAGFLKFGPMGFVYLFLSLVLPAATLMIIVYRFVDKMKSSKKFKKIATYISPVCVGIFLSVAYTFLSKYANTNSILNFENISLIVIAGISFMLIDKYKVDPMYVILAALVFGGIMTTF